MSKQVKKVKAWAGVIEGRIDMSFGPLLVGGNGSSSGVFSTKALAKRHYECVIPVEIIPVPPKKARKR